MAHSDPIVAVALLTQRELERMGDSFDRAFPIDEDTAFDDLMEKLRQVDWQR